MGKFKCYRHGSSKVTEGEKEREYVRYYITSLKDIHEFAYAVRKHWSVENQLHWCLDVIFREDAARARKNIVNVK